MAFEKAFIPYGAYWSTPFSKWQGSLAGENAVKLAAQVAADVLARKSISPEVFDAVDVGFTVPQHHSFYGAPWLAGMIGATGVTGPIIAQACATSARLVAHAALQVETGNRQCLLSVACDRTSNGPHVYYPNPNGPGGKGDAEDWVWDNFSRDPFAKNAMIETAENVAKEAGISREAQDELTLIRHEQYQRALASDRAFQRKYMVPVTLKMGRKEKVVDADEGVFGTTKEGLAALKPVMRDGGTVTFGSQTFPADGNCGLVICAKDQAARLATDKSVTIEIKSYGEARTKKGFMAMAVVPAAQQALERAGIAIADCKAIKTHNPFAVNDVYFCNKLDVKAEAMNNYGSSLIYGHPQAPTGMRLMIEMIEELAELGGGYGLFAGCAAGDTAMAVVLKVGR